MSEHRMAAEVASSHDLDESWQPAAVRLINTAGEIKALADPLRMRIVQLLMARFDRSWSAKEIAGELDQATTKLYHHLKMLEAAGLITDVESRLVSGILEHRYRTSQKSLQFDDSLFGSPETRPDSIAQMAAVVDTTRDDLLDYLNRDGSDYEAVSLSKMTVRLHPEEIQHVNDIVAGLVQQYRSSRDDPARAALPNTSMLFLMHPSIHDGTPPPD